MLFSNMCFYFRYVDDFRLCCEFVSAIPGFSDSYCIIRDFKSPLNQCGSLMRNHVLRVFIWIIGLSALIGNSMVVIWRCRQRTETHENKTHSFLVLNLAISDLMMGVYMLIIAIADLQFGEKYFKGADRWRSSAVCKIAGVLSVLSSEASVFFVTIISIECFIGIVFPFGKIKIRGKSSKVIVSIIWVVATCLSIVPTVIGGTDSKIYGLSDVCIGLPLITHPNSVASESTAYTYDNSILYYSVPIAVVQGEEPSWIYSIVLFIGLNTLCFIIVVCCYIAIFVSVQNTTRQVRVAAHRKREVGMAIKMAFIVGTDFACWMPVIIMGILSQTGTVKFSLDMYAWVAVFILPINSSVNPYLYTIVTAVATRRKHAIFIARQQRLNMIPLTPR